MILGSTAALLLLASAARPFPATVNDKPITEPEVAKALRQRIEKTSYHRQLPPQRLKAERAQAVETLVTEELRAQEARRRGLKIPMEPIEKLAAAEEANAGGKQQFDALLAANGIDRARYLEIIERPELAKRLVETEVAARLTEPTREEALAHHRANPSRYVVPGAVHVRELCARVEPWANEEGWKEGKRKAAELRARLVKGDDFARAAREAACDAFAEKGGDLGFVHEGSIDPAMEKAAWALKDGEISEPVRTLRGWHLLLRVESKAPRPLPFEQVEAPIRAELREARREEIVKRLDAGLRARARITLPDES